MVWQPIDLQQACPAHTQLTACTSFGYLYLNLLVRLFGKAKEDKTESNHDDNERVVNYVNGKGYSDEEGTYTNEEEGYDFIVVGAGSAGCVVANRLTEVENWKVLLLEAGPEEPDITLVPGLSTALLGSNVDWQYKTQYDGKSCLGQKGRICAWPRGKMMGGSSSINSFVYIRGNKADFDEWDKLGNDGWSYDDVLPYFKKSEDNVNIEGFDRKYHGIDGPQTITRWQFADKPSIMLTEAFNQRGLPLTDFNGKRQYGTMQAQVIGTRDSQRASTNTAFIRPIRNNRKNLTVRTESEVIKILIDPKHKKAYGVVYMNNGKEYTAIAKREVVVSGGAINSPKLLMLSGIGPAEELDKLNIDVVKDLSVGRNLHDHVTFNGVVIALSNETSTAVSNDKIIEEIYEYKKNKDYSGPLIGNGPVCSVAFIKTQHNLEAPDIQFQVDSINWREYVREPANFEKLAILPTSYYDGLMPRTMLLRPKSRGTLLLNSTDPVFGPPLLFPNYLADQEDVDTLLAGVRYLLTLEKTKAFKSRGAYFVRTPMKACENFQWGSDKYYICMMRAYTSTPFHPVGTCKMGPEWDSEAVVDPQLKVYGVSGLRVVDASIMPVITRGNTNAPSIMIGEKGADLIKKDWLEGC